MKSIYFRIINQKELFALYDEIEQLSDPGERKKREELLDRIHSVIGDYDVHIREYAFAQHGKAVLARGVKAVPESGTSLKRRWSRLFAAGIGPEQKKAVYFNQYRWHLFSYRVLPALQGMEAEDAFAQAQKDTVYAFYQHCDDGWRLENAHLIRPEDFVTDVPCPWTDVYLFDPVNRWTYIHTHEPDCGPYFFRV